MNSVQSGGTNIKKKDSQYDEGPIFAEESRNWRGIFISILVIASVLGMILFSIFILTPVEENSMAGRKLISLSELKNRKFEQHNYKFTWINDKAFVMMDRDKKLLMFDVEEMSKSSHVDNTTFRQLDVQDYLLSSDLKYVLLYSKSTNERGTQYFIYEMESSNVTPLSATDNNNKTTVSYIQKVIWGPGNNYSDANKNQAIAFVHKYDIYYKPKVQDDLLCRVTMTGKKDFVLNGIPDWLYANIDELKSETLVFSTDGTYLAFFSFNLTNVKEYNYTNYDSKTLYPRVESMRYPKAYTPNPEVTVFVANLSVLKYIFPKKIKLPDDVPRDCYVGGVLWTQNDELSVTMTYRNQTKMMIFLCHPPQFKCVQVYSESPLKPRWISPAENLFYSTSKILLDATTTSTNEHENLTTTTTTSSKPTTAAAATPSSTAAPPSTAEFSLNGFSKFLLKTKYIASTENRKLYFRHIVLISISDQKVFAVTSGQMEVLRIMAWDEDKKKIYFLATGIEKPGERHLYRKLLDTDHLVASYGKRRSHSMDDLECLTCSTELKLFNSQADNMTIYHYYNTNNANNQNNNNNNDHRTYNSSINCLYNDITLSRKYSYYILECLGPNVPSIYLIDTETNEKISTIDDGILFHRRMVEYIKPEMEQFAVQTKNGFLTQVKVYLPPDMKKNLAATFPLILHVDSSPGSQLVDRKFGVDFNWYLSTVKSYIVVQIDGRGSGFNGDILLDESEKYLGATGVEDQLAVLSYLRDNFNFIDSTHICTYGWGYGGYAVSMLLIEDYRKIILCGIAINPIVNFKFYNSFFTERYFTDTKESTGLEDDVASKALDLQARNYFLIQGTGDELVHEQHAFSLVKSMVEKEVIFRQQVYKDEGHHLKGIFLHLYKTIETFYDEHFIKSKKISTLITSKEWRRLKKID